MLNDILANNLIETPTSEYAVYQGYNSFFQVPVYKIVPYEGMGLDLPTIFVGQGNNDVKGQAYLLICQNFLSKSSAEAFIERQKLKLASQ